METVNQNQSASQQPPSWEELLKRAVSEPGTISRAYSMFHSYSLGNQLLAMFQCSIRGIQPGPIATFPGWKEKGRHVMKGAKAITLCMPVTCKGKQTKTNPETCEETEEEKAFTRFVYRNNWFVLSQTEGEPYQAPELPQWNRARALQALGISEEPFSVCNGNVMGYAHHKSIAINPVNPMAEKTTFHELAHIMLGHTSDGNPEADGRDLPRTLKEAEAESVALLCLASLNLPGQDECRGYIQNWFGHAEIPEKSAQRIFKAADQILKAGRAAQN